MQQYFETLSIIVLSLAAFILACMIILNLYLIKRNGFYVRVNCWFCNSCTKVLYQNRNSFDCPICDQYNGFKEDGSYNKVIEAQHNTSFTKYTQKTEFSDNGLCTYCNNNQQLKIYQLAKFTPINELNYDIEVEHFRKQLENAYKLCKKCEQVLKSKIKIQHSWIFGNRLKDLRKKGYNTLKHTKLPKKIIKNSNFFKYIRYILIISTIVILCNLLNIKIVYPNPGIKEHLPEVFNLYKTVFSDYQQKISEVFKEFPNKLLHINKFLEINIKFKNSDIAPITYIGFCLDFMLNIGEQKTFIWKINGLFGWILLIITSSLSFSNIFTPHIFGIQIFTSLSLLYMYIWSSSSSQLNSTLKEYSFKKLSNSKTVESSEEETDEDDPRHLIDTSKTFLKARRTYSPLGHSMNNVFTTAKSVTSTSEYDLTDSSSDLNRSLDNLHLGLNSQRCTSPIFSVSSSKRPILSPSKLKNITQNPWTAGGFWKNDVNIFSAATNGTNFSRSSSQTSGFVSNHNNNINKAFNSLPASREPSLGGDVERVSLLSEPAYHFAPISPNLNPFNTPNSPQLYYKADNNTFYPVLGQNSMLFIQNGISQQHFKNNSTNSFGRTVHSEPFNIFSDQRSDCSIKNFGTKNLIYDNSEVKSVNTPSIYSEKPVSPLFKNLQMSDTFKKPRL
ncbi:uncharacterized protein LOC130898692 [Diorhabda carinulata]|uniref:uncharacterized protein LOC130898692 n=1 Tax=Diorhabda carinulata TaxID=1163345 RepID=UPI0025A02FCF|nr:uncharacterized protein LOC130898692 [Diorhabda carinulata]